MSGTVDVVGSRGTLTPIHEERGCGDERGSVDSPLGRSAPTGGGAVAVSRRGGARRVCGRLIVALCCLAPAAARAACLAPPGDITADGATTILDVQCESLVVLWTLGAMTGPIPSCLAAPGSPLEVADQNCDGAVDVVDTVLTVRLALALGLPAAIDANGDECADACGAATPACTPGLPCGAGGTCLVGPTGQPTCCIPDAKATTCAGVQCGNRTNNCGLVVWCGTCGAGQTCNATGQCVANVVLLSDYWPTSASKLYRRADGSVYLLQVHDPIEPHAAQMPAKAGSTYWRLHDFGTLAYDDGPTDLVYLDTWHMRNNVDGEVAEVADNYPDRPIVNGTFDQGTTGWTGGNGTIQVVGGSLHVVNAGASYGYAYQVVATEPGKRYAISCTASAPSAGTVYVRAGTSIAAYDLGGTSTSSPQPTKLRFFFTATTSQTYVTVLNSNAPNGVGVFDDVRLWFTEPHYAHTAYYYADNIGHGRAGGHVVGETKPYEQWNIDYWWGANASPPKPPQPPTVSKWAYSRVWVVERLASFTPEYGSDATGFGPGKGPTYHDVVRVRFQHGTANADAVCPNQPPQFVHVPGYTSFWTDFWMAPGIGKVQAHILWHEAYCDGHVNTPSAWSFYLDTIQ